MRVTIKDQNSKNAKKYGSIKLSGPIANAFAHVLKGPTLFKDFREKLWDLLSQAMLFNCAKENGGGMEEVGRRVQPKRSRRSQIIHRYMYIYFRGERLLISSFANFFFPLKSTQVSSAQIPKKFIDINIQVQQGCSLLILQHLIRKRILMIYKVLFWIKCLAKVFPIFKFRSVLKS